VSQLALKRYFIRFEDGCVAIVGQMDCCVAPSLGWQYLQVKTPLKCGPVFCLGTICFLFSQSRRRQVRKKDGTKAAQLHFNGVDNVSHGDTKRRHTRIWLVLRGSCDATPLFATFSSPFYRNGVGVTTLLLNCGIKF